MCDNTLFLCNIWFLYRASFSAALKNIDFSGFSHVFLWQRSIGEAFDPMPMDYSSICTPAFSRMVGTFFSAPMAMIWTPSHRC